ncbi:MAG: hypothetical protein HXX17_01575 [Geobacteraceae bacterium]|nr:hypothetical protein [Geobacteraceae bacterium]
MSNGKRKAIAIFAYWYPVAFSPSIINSATALADEGYSVDIIVDRYIFNDIEITRPSIRVIYCTSLPPVHRAGSAQDSSSTNGTKESPTSFLTRLANTLELQKPWNWLVTRFHLKWFYERLLFLLGAWKVVKGRDFSFFIGAEPEGLFVASVLGRLKRVNYCYHSLELFLLTDSSSRLDKLRKSLEADANRGAAFTLIQDEARAACLIKANGLSSQPVILLPVSEPGPAVTQKTKFLHTRLGIDESKKIVLALGGIFYGNFSLEIAMQTISEKWPEDWVLVFHGFCSDAAYVGKIMESSHPGRVYLSVDPVSIDELTILTASADIGIALYDSPDDDNNALTIFSSGKIAQYMKCGLPIIVNDFPATVAVVTEYGCGRCIHDVDSLIVAINSIDSDLAQYRERALKMFSLKYDFINYFSKVISMIGASSNG